MKPTAMIVMAKQPLAGQTKTRLCPPLSPTQAATLYEGLLLDTLALVDGLPGIDLAIAITPPTAQPYFRSITAPGTRLLAVTGPDIGDCLTQALGGVLGMGYHKALALNSDGPSLPPEYLSRAVAALDEADIVLGPSLDGGYYLVGMKHLQAGLFQGLAWSTDRVFAETLQRAEELGLRAALAPGWYDIDTPLDLQRLQDELRRLPAERLAHTRRRLSEFRLDPGRA